MWTFRGSYVFEMNRTNVWLVQNITSIESWKWWTFLIIINLFIVIIINCAAREMSHIMYCMCGWCSLCLHHRRSYYLKNLNNKTKTNDHIASENNGTRMDGMNWTTHWHATKHICASLKTFENVNIVWGFVVEAHQMNALPWLKWAFHNLLGVVRIYIIAVCTWNKSLGRFFCSRFFLLLLFYCMQFETIVLCDFNIHMMVEYAFCNGIPKGVRDSDQIFDLDGMKD